MQTYIGAIRWRRVEESDERRPGVDDDPKKVETGTMKSVSNKMIQPGDFQTSKKEIGRAGEQESRRG